MKIRIDIKTINPMNSSQGLSRGGMIARSRKKKEQRQLAGHFVSLWQNTPWRHELSAGLVITLCRVAPSEGLDPDENLPGALKAIKDGVADGLGLSNDRDPRIRWKYDQRRGRKGEYAVEIDIQPRVAASKGAGE